MMLFLVVFHAAAQTPPDRQVPEPILAEVQQLQHHFEVALASDCNPRFCAPKGCSYVAHSVADRPARSALPGLSMPSSDPASPPQAYLTQAECSFGWEARASETDMQALAGRLQAKLSHGWLTVNVAGEPLPAIPSYLGQPARPPEPVPEPVPEAPPWSMELAGQQLWDALLPHMAWMIGLLLATVAGVVLIWANRRLGVLRVDDTQPLTHLDVEDDVISAVVQTVPEEAAVADPFTKQQAITWGERLSPMSTPDPTIRALLGGLLRQREFPLLARAMMQFPKGLPSAFPTGGHYAAAKHELAMYLQGVSDSELPSERELYDALNRHVLSAELTAQTDASAIATLQQDYGAAGLADLADAMPPRLAGLVFALSSTDTQWEVARLLDASRVAQMTELLLYSNRMDPSESETLFRIAAGGTAPSVADGQVTDRGAIFDAPSALSILLESLDDATQQHVFHRVLMHFQGMLPRWHKEVFFSGLLMQLEYFERADLLMSIDVPALAAWLSRFDRATRQDLLRGTPSALSAAVRAAEANLSASRRSTLERHARRAISDAFRDTLTRSGSTFEDVIAPRAIGAAS